MTLNRVCGFKKWKIVEFLLLSVKTASKSRNLIKSYRILKIMAAKKVTTKTYCNIDEILDFALEEADPESNIEVYSGDGIIDDKLESDWEYESEPNATKQSETMKTVYVCAFVHLTWGYILIFVLSYIILC